MYLYGNVYLRCTFWIFQLQVSYISIIKTGLTIVPLALLYLHCTMRNRGLRGTIVLLERSVFPL